MAMLFRFRLATPIALALSIGAAAPLARAQDDSAPRRGRKYKVPPETSHIEVQVLKDSNGKPVSGAAVVFHAVKDGRDEGNLEVKTNEDGKAVIDVIATGSDVEVQVIADGFATYAGDYQVAEASRSIEIKMLRPRAQISNYIDNSGRTSERPMGVQEPATPATLPGTPVQVPQQRTTNQNQEQRPGLQVTPSATPSASKNAPVQQKPVQTNPPTTSPLDTPDPVTSSPIQTNPPPHDLR